MPYQVPFSQPFILELNYPPFLPLSSEPRMLSICMVPAGMANPPDPLGSVSLLVSSKTSAF